MIDPDNKHLFLETLDTIKLFMTRREFLIKFKCIPESLKDLELDSDCDELIVGVMQVLAVLSFEKECHDALKNSDFIEKLQRKGIFAKIFALFESQKNDKAQGRMMEENYSARFLD